MSRTGMWKSNWVVGRICSNDTSSGQDSFLLKCLNTWTFRLLEDLLCEIIPESLQIPINEKLHVVTRGGARRSVYVEPKPREFLGQTVDRESLDIV